MNPPAAPIAERLEALRSSLAARAAGFWRLAADQLEQQAFVAAGDMSDDVARGFAVATRSVSLSQSALGIVRAAVEKSVTVSRASELPPDVGSGLWLRRFGAARSVAVPVFDRSGRLTAVVSVALAEAPPDDEDVARAVRAAAEAWSENPNA